MFSPFDDVVCGRYVSSVMDILHLVQVSRITLGLHVVAMNEPQRG